MERAPPFMVKIDWKNFLIHIWQFIHQSKALVKLIRDVVFLWFWERERDRTISIPWPFSTIRSKALLRSAPIVPRCSWPLRSWPFTVPDRSWPFPSVFYRFMIENAHKTVENAHKTIENAHKTVENVRERSGTVRNGHERSRTVNGQERWTVRNDRVGTQ